jgi:peptidylprolyl isomerase
LDGTEFDSSKEPVESPLDKWVSGFAEGLSKMKKGSKATMIIPSSLAYGPRGGGPIPPYATLTFTVEMLDIKPAQPQPQQPQAMPGQ